MFGHTNVLPVQGFAPSAKDVDNHKGMSAEAINLEQFESFLLTIAHPEDQIENMVSFFRDFDLSVSRLHKKTDCQ